MKSYVVIRNAGEWEIRSPRGRAKFFATKTQALCAAIEFAESDGESGSSAHVLVQDEDGVIRAEWTYGRDAYPDKRAPASFQGRAVLDDRR